MLLDKYVSIKINPANRKYYENKRYKIPTKINDKGKECIDWGSIITVKVEDLSDGSNAKVHVCCDNCGKEMIVVYNTYYNQYTKKGTDGKYYCKSCSIIHAKQTTMKKYGVDHIRHVKEIHEKIINTNMEKYGGKSPAASKDVMDKIKETNIEKYGVVCPLQLEENIKLARKGCIKKYGTLHPFQSDRYWEEQKRINMEKYGCEWITQAPEIKEKVAESFKNNSTMKSSSQQRYIHNLYGGELNYLVSRFFVDIFVEKDKNAIEYDGGAHNLMVQTGKINQEEFDNKELVREKIIRSNGIRIIRIISPTDKLPSDEVLLKMYNEATEYFDSTGHTWRHYYVEESMYRDAEHQDKSPYNYGELWNAKKSFKEKTNSLNY